MCSVRSADTRQKRDLTDDRPDSYCAWTEGDVTPGRFAGTPHDPVACRPATTTDQRATRQPRRPKVDTRPAADTAGNSQTPCAAPRSTESAPRPAAVRASSAA